MNNQKLISLLSAYGNKFTVDELRGITTRGEPRGLDAAFLEHYLKFRLFHGYPTMILSAYRPNDRRSHGAGLAIDSVLFTRWRAETPGPMELCRLANVWGFKGVGIYFDWTVYGTPVVGLHTDNLDDHTRPARWIRITENINGAPTRLYFYQNFKTGKFFNEGQKRVITLKDAINTHGPK